MYISSYDLGDFVLTTNDLVKLKVLYKKGFSLNQCGTRGNSYLHQAVALRNVDIVHFLVSEGVDLNVRNNSQETPLHLAAKMKTKEGPEIVRALIEGGGVLDRNASSAPVGALDVNAFASDRPQNDAAILSMLDGWSDAPATLEDYVIRIEILKRHVYTPLTVALYNATEASLETIRLLIEAGAHTPSVTTAMLDLTEAYERRGIKDEPPLCVASYILSRFKPGDANHFCGVVVEMAKKNRHKMLGFAVSLLGKLFDQSEECLDIIVNDFDLYKSKMPEDVKEEAENSLKDYYTKKGVELGADFDFDILEDFSI